MSEKEDKKVEKEVELQDESELEEQAEVLEETHFKEELEAKIAELEDLRLRDLAEFENIKKRLEKEKTQSIAYSHEGFARDLLSVIDSLDSANAMMDDDSELDATKIKEGIDLTIEQFKKIFQKHGIELVSIENEFDPNFHEAVMKVDSDEKEGTIVQVFQKGYKIKDRILRPAMVSIAK